MMKIASVVGARPQFIKLFPLVRTIHDYNISTMNQKIEHQVIHSGQHYDYEMNKLFFDELEIPEPNYNLEVGSGTHAWQTGEIIKRTEKVLKKENPEWILVYGDTNTTLAGALAATKLHIPIAHVEAGLRSYNRKMPEEVNRILTDHCSDMLFCPTENAIKNLKQEGFTNILNKGKLTDSSTLDILNPMYKLPAIINVGDIMNEALFMSLKSAETKSTILEKLKLKPKEYYFVTIHRAENTENKKRLKEIMEALIEISKKTTIIFPVHPRTKKSFKSILSNTYSLNDESIRPGNNLRIINPLSYFDSLILAKNALKILTDSGGVQKEAYFLKVPCITLREETEWIETVKDGWNFLSGADKAKIIEASQNFEAKYHTTKYQKISQTSSAILKILVDIQNQSILSNKHS